MPGATLPPTFAHPEDARAQLLLAREYHTKLFGAPPRGVWPSEGSVCPELIPIMQDLGFEWFATDEEILWRSLATFRGNEPFDRNRLFEGYRAQFGDASVCAAFRDRTLSDFIGFSASRNDPQHAAEFMVGHLDGIARSEPDGFCAVILDGENAWEHFRDGGESFLREFYQRLTTISRRTRRRRSSRRCIPARGSMRTSASGSAIPKTIAVGSCSAGRATFSKLALTGAKSHRISSSAR
jgi:alpha-amylase/alpha-mannosidase (GH57 family)